MAMTAEMKAEILAFLEQREQEKKRKHSFPQQQKGSLLASPGLWKKKKSVVLQVTDRINFRLDITKTARNV